MRRLLLVFIAFALTSGLGLSQTQNLQRFKISGSVVSSTDSQAVRGALVEAFGQERKSAMTTADGHFEIDNVPSGYLSLVTRRPGFEQQLSSQRRFKIDGNLDGVTLKLTPLSKISGKVVDREGDPIEGINIQCLREQVQNGYKQWTPSQGTNTDEAGSFVIDDLSPGTYILRAAEKQLYIVQSRSEAARYVYPTTYYPDSPSRDLAQQIDLAPGTERKADMTLRSLRGARITLTTEPSSPNLTVNIRQGDDQSGPTIGARLDRSGERVFPAVPPGTWKIEVRSPFGIRRGPQTTEVEYGELEVDVGTEDLDGLKIALAALPEIPILVSGVQSPSPGLQLQDKHGVYLNGSVAGPNGEVRLINVLSGTYRVIVIPNGFNSCITSLTSGSQDLMREPLVVSAGAQPPPIQMVESNACNRIEATTNSREPAAVIVTSDKLSFQPQNYGNVTNLSIQNLADGDYQLYAFDDTSELEYANSDALRGFKATSVHLEGGKSESVQLDVNVRRPL